VYFTGAADAAAAGAEDDERRERDRPAAAAAGVDIAALPTADHLLAVATRRPGAGGSAAEAAEPFVTLLEQLRRKKPHRALLTLEDAEAVLHAARSTRAPAHLNDVYDGQLWRDMQHWRPASADGIHDDWLPRDMRRPPAADSPAVDSAVPMEVDEECESERPDTEADEVSQAGTTSTVQRQRELAEVTAQQQRSDARASAEQARYARAAAEQAREEWPYTGALLAAPHTLALQLFVDWYQKHDQGHHSVGLIWACVLNLPREERYELHNMLLVGVLPGPQESSHTQLQGALQVLTAELRQLWVEGLEVRQVRHRVFLFSVVCDTPAMRAVCGLGRESSVHGCPYCDGPFATRPGKSSHRDWRPSATFKADGSNELRHPPHTHGTRMGNALAWVAAHQYLPIEAWLQRKTSDKNWRADSVADYLNANVFKQSAAGASRGAHPEGAEAAPPPRAGGVPVSRQRDVVGARGGAPVNHPSPVHMLTRFSVLLSVCIRAPAGCCCCCCCCCLSPLEEHSLVGAAGPAAPGPHARRADRRDAQRAARPVQARHVRPLGPPRRAESRAPTPAAGASSRTGAASAGRRP
jgi:hypothetical protein